MANSTRPKARKKPEKPYEGFPLFAHPSGQCAKKISRKLVVDMGSMLVHM